MEERDERLERLEGRVDFQAHDLEQLDRSLAAQQREIETLSARVSALERLLSRLDPSLFQGGPTHHG